MAARFAADRAADQGLASGQGTPIHITMETPRPWVPLRILGLGLDEDEVKDIIAQGVACVGAGTPDEPVRPRGRVG